MAVTILEPKNISMATWDTVGETPFLLVSSSCPAVGCQCRRHFLLENHRLHVVLGEAWKAALVERLAFLFPGENSFVLMFYWVNTIKTVCATIFLVMGHKFLAIYPCMRGFLDILRMFMVGIECAGFRLPSLTLSQPRFLLCSHCKLLPPPGSVRHI